MDPEQFNLLGGLNEFQPFNTAKIDSMAPSDLTLSAVDSSGNDTMPGLGSILNIGGDLFSAFGDFTAGAQSQQAYEYNANLALEQGKIDVQQLDYQEHATLSSQKAIYGKAGVAMSGSVFDAAASTASQFEMDKQIANYNAQSKANMDRYEGEMAKKKADFQGGMQLLNAGIDVAMMFL